MPGGTQHKGFNMGKARKLGNGPVLAVQVPTSNGGLRTTWHGYSASALYKWFGSNGYAIKQAAAFASAVGLTGNTSTLHCQFYSGRAAACGRVPTHTGKPAALPAALVTQVTAIVGTPNGTPLVAAVPAVPAVKGKGKGKGKVPAK